jgi:hypothetical protein
MMKSRSLFFLLIFLNLSAFSQIEKHAQWKFSVSKNQLKTGESLEVNIEADIDEGWYLYSTDFDPNLYAPHASISFEGSGFKESGKLKAIGSKEKFDEFFGNIKIFTGKARFTQKLIITDLNPQITIKIDGPVCSHENGLCVWVMETYSFNEIKVTGAALVSPDTNRIKPSKAKLNQSSYSSERLKELEKAKQSLVKKDGKGRDTTREYLKDYVKKNGGNK